MHIRSSKNLLLFLLLLLGALTLGVGWWMYTDQSHSHTPSITVTEDTVTRQVAVSGTVTQRNTAHLSFPAQGTIDRILVEEGDRVAADEVVATLNMSGLQDDIREAQATLAEAIASQQELLAGPTDLSRSVIDTQVRHAEEHLQRVKEEQAQLITTARRTLLSTDLAAVPVNPEERMPIPTVSGTYRCEETGTYRVAVFSSSAESGFSMRVTGLEEDVVPGSFTQSVPFGSCGLRIQLTEGLHYNRTEWTIDVPNTASSFYIKNSNAYETAKLTAQNAIEAAQDALDLAIQQRARDTAPTRSEQVAQANARIAQIEARIDRLQTREIDHTLRAPFAGSVTRVDAVAGETVGSSPVITILGAQHTDYELTVRVPEIDITHILPGQPAHIQFDARPDEIFNGEITYVATAPIDVHGVTYYEATVRIADAPPWIRIGLHADVDIEVDSQTGPRVPLGFIADAGTDPAVFTGSAREPIRVPVDIALIGTDGYAHVTGIDSGTTLIAP